MNDIKKYDIRVSYSGYTGKPIAIAYEVEGEGSYVLAIEHKECVRAILFELEQTTRRMEKLKEQRNVYFTICEENGLTRRSIQFLDEEVETKNEQF